MTRYNTTSRGSSFRKPLTIAAATVLTAGALAGAGIAGANAATPVAAAVSSTVHAGSQHAGLIADVQAAFGAGSTGANANAGGHVDGAKAKELATKLVGNQQLFPTLPAPLQADLKSLAGAYSPDEATTVAQKIKDAALGGGYGEQVKTVAGHLLGEGTDAADPAGKDAQSLLPDLKAAVGQGQQAGESAQRLAQKVTANKDLFSHLPAKLQADVTALADASGADVTAQAQKLKSTALDGGYGQQVQKTAQRLVAIAAGSSDQGTPTPDISGSAGAGATSSS